MEEALILSGVRTPIGAFMGALSSLTDPQLGAIAIREAVKQAGVAPETVDEVIMGCVLTGGQGQAPARQAASYGGLPTSVLCMTLNNVCCSGMKALTLPAQATKLGDPNLA